MILTDDHFASIVHAVEEVITVYRNIQKFLTYILIPTQKLYLCFLLVLFGTHTSSHTWLCKS